MKSSRQRRPDANYNEDPSRIGLGPTLGAGDGDGVSNTLSSKLLGSMA